MSFATRGILGTLKGALNQRPAEQDLSSLAKPFETDTIAGEIDTIQWLGNIPGFRERGEKKKGTDLVPQKLDVRMREFDATWRIKGATVRNSKIGPILADKAGQWSRRRIDLSDALIASLINTSESQNAYDGQFFFDTDHAVNESGTIDNDITFDATDHNNPTDLEYARAIMKGLQQFYTFKDDQGLPLYKPMQNIDVVVPVAMLSKALVAVGLTKIDGGAGDVDNPLFGFINGMGVKIRVKTSPLITLGNTKIVLLNRSAGCAPFLLGENPAEKRVTELDESSDYYKREDMYEFNAFWTGAASYGEFTDGVLVTLN